MTRTVERGDDRQEVSAGFGSGDGAAEAGESVAVEAVRAGAEWTSNVKWFVRLLDDGAYVIRSDGSDWTVEPGEIDDADVVITATRHGWALFLATDPSTADPEGCA